MRNTILLLGALLLAGCSDPIFILPGGALSGELTTPPSDWSAIADPDVVTIQVDFRPSDPYSHNIWAVGIGADLYIAASPDGNRWTPFLETDPRVRARHGSELYDLVAVEIVDVEERARVLAAYKAKYAPDNYEWVERALIYRLDRAASP